MRQLILGALITLAATPVGGQSITRLEADTGRRARRITAAGGSAWIIRSNILRQTRHIGIVLPASYTKSASPRRYPVTVVFDGEAYLRLTSFVPTELARNGQIPETIVVAIENVDQFQGRVHDLTPRGLSGGGSGLAEGGDAFLDFIENELLPAVDRQFRGGLPRVMVGHS